MHIIHQVGDWVYKIEKMLVVFFGLLILISLSAGVFFRYVLSEPLVWSGEISLFSLVWLTFIGGSMSIKLRSAPAIEVITMFLKKKTRQAVIATGSLILVIFIGYMLYLSIDWITASTIFVQYSGSMRMPMIIPYLSIPVSFTFMFIHSIELFLYDLTHRDEETV